MLIAIGDNCLDVYPFTGQTYVGGNALNVAVNWARAGLDAHYFGSVGDDSAAEIVVNAAALQGLDPSEIERVPGLTGVTLVELIDGDRNFVFEEFGVGQTWQPGPAALAAAAAAEWVHIAGVDLSSGIVEQLAASGKRVSVDLSTFGAVSGFSGCTVAFASAPDGLDSAWGRAEELIAAGAQTAIVTLGDQGSVAISSSGERVRAEAESANAIDTCGAGDSFIAETISSILDGEPLADALEGGALAAARTCEHEAGFPQQATTTIPWIYDHYLQPRGYPEPGSLASPDAPTE